MRVRSVSHPGPASALRPVCGPRAVPGRAALRLRSNPAALAADLRDEFGDVAALRVLGRDVVVVQRPDAAAELLRDADRAFAAAPVYGFALGTRRDRGSPAYGCPQPGRARRTTT